MTDEPLIPTSPAEADYEARLAQAQPLPLLPEGDHLALFQTWLAEAKASEPNDANAMALATVDADGMPDVRMVLLKAADASGFTFFTNYNSAKGRQILGAGKAALLFHWKSLRRQVRVRGTVAPVSDAEADAYFATRARGSQLGAWASEQSSTLPDRFALEKRVAEFALKFGVGKVARPPHWSGFRLTPVSIEYWRDRPFRLHERLLYEKAGNGWAHRRLYP